MEINNIIDDLVRRIITAQEEMRKNQIDANLVIINGNKYSKLFDGNIVPSICGMAAQVASLPDNMDFVVQYKFSKTNADRIREKTDEELAEFIAYSTSCETCVVRKGGSDECHNTNCSTAWLDWLKQEVEE